MGREIQLLKEALGRVTEELCLVNVGRPVYPEAASAPLPDLLSPSDCFDWSVGRLGEIAGDAARHLEESVAATALIEARGDRLDRLNAENPPCSVLSSMARPLQTHERGRGAS